MRINISLPIKFIPWISYLIIFLAVELFVIFPLSALIWDDFYQKIIPNNSLKTYQFQPELIVQNLNYKNTHSRITYGYVQEVNRLPPVIHSKSTSLESSKHLKAKFSHIFDVNIQIYCYDSSIPIHTIKVSVDGFEKYATIVCFSNLDLVIPSNKLSLNRLSEKVKNDFVNLINFDSLLVNRQSKLIDIQLVSDTPLIFGENSILTIRTKLGTLQNAIIRWNKLAYVLGTLLFTTIISCWFSLGFLIMFSYMGILRARQDTNSPPT